MEQRSIAAIVIMLPEFIALLSWQVKVFISKLPAFFITAKKCCKAFIQSRANQRKTAANTELSAALQPESLAQNQHVH
ncbi:hypothetical protein [Microbulbifer marinus]|uniref:hypothetical protein n=1 Tax=Microbulbifer marinus TaxID=658218 RepID=UPI0011152378|nr:hypothetical protein [Microbulbifer marinus]